MKTAIFDVATGVETIRDLTAEELTTIENEQTQIEAVQAEEAELAAQKTSANEKLEALGLTAAEIAALTGS